MKRFFSKHYLLFTFLASLVVAVGASFMFYNIARTDAKQDEVGEALNFIVIVVILGLVATWPRWFLVRLNGLIASAVGPLGNTGDPADVKFEQRVGSAFGDELVANVFAYEAYCKNEYVQDMQKHYLAWLMLAVSGALTLVAALLAVFARSGDGKWLAAIGVTLPALITGILLKIWLETRSNLRRTIERTDAIYRQRIRLLLLLANPDDLSVSGWDGRIALNRDLIEYLTAPGAAGEPGE